MHVRFRCRLTVVCQMSVSSAPSDSCMSDVGVMPIVAGEVCRRRT